MLKIKEINSNKPPRILIYGEIGVGKSTFAANAPKPIVMSLEGGFDQIKRLDGQKLVEFEKIRTFQQARESVMSLLNEKHDFETLIIDSADWLENACQKQIIGSSGKAITTVNGGYGAGLEQSKEMHSSFIELLDRLRDEKNMAIIVTAHSQVRAQNDPSLTENFDMIELKGDKRIVALWKEWCDALLFAKFDIIISGKDSKARAVTDGKRLIFSERQAAFFAKNRFGLPTVAEFTQNYYNDEILSRINSNVPLTESVSAISAEIGVLIASSGLDEITLESIKNEAYGYLDANNTDGLNKIRTRLKKLKGE